MNLTQHQNNPESYFERIVPNVSKYEISDQIKQQLLNDLTANNIEKIFNESQKIRIK